MALARARRDAGMNYWPGFVDALSTLILGIIFLLSVFVVVQFYLTQEVTGKGHRAQPPQLPDRAAHGAALAGEDRQAEPGGAAGADSLQSERGRRRARAF
jgi:hypothetical protein